MLYRECVNWLTWRRKMNGWSYRKLAKITGVSATSLFQWEHFKTQPTAQNFINWIEALDFRIELKEKRYDRERRD